MKRFIFLLLTLLISVWVGLKITKQPSYLIIAYHKTLLEMPLWFALIILIGIFLLLWVVTRLWVSIFSSGKNFRLWQKYRRIRKARRYTNQGLIELAEGNWRVSEKDLIKAASSSEIPLINYLAAAKAAQEQEAYERRDEYLELAYKNNTKAKIAIGLTQAQLQLHHQQWEQALATLRNLQESMPHHPFILKLLKKIYFLVKDWASMAKLIPDLYKYKVYNSKKIMQLEEMTYIKLLEAAGTKNYPPCDKVWQMLPNYLKKTSAIIQVYVVKLLQLKQDRVAEKLITQSVKKSWNSQLAYLYGFIELEDYRKLLTQGEIWLKNHPNDPLLYLTLGKLALKNQLWGKARDYLEKSLELKPCAETYFELGQLNEHQQSLQAAKEYYRKGLLYKLLEAQKNSPINIKIPSLDG